MSTHRGKPHKVKYILPDEVWLCKECEVVLDQIDGRKPRCPVCRREDTVVPVPRLEK